MRFRIASNATTPVTGWTTCVSPDATGAVTPSPKAEDGTALKRILSELLACDHLVVLAGLGTSLEIIDPTSTRPRFPTMTDLWAVVEAKSGASFASVRKLVRYTVSTERNLEELLSRCQMAVDLGIDNADGDIRIFLALAEQVISSTCSYRPTVSETQVHEDFLRRLLRRAPRKSRPNLFTTNYDVCFETAAARMGIPLLDGFTFAQPRRFSPDTFDFDIVRQGRYTKEPNYLPHLIKLYKLHGSVDWQTMPDGIEKIDTPTKPLLIYPRYGKFEASYTQPFLEMMSRFQTSLRAENVGVLTICTGFRDPHLAEPLLAAVKSNTGLRLVVVAPDLNEQDATALYGTPTQGQIQSNAYVSQVNRLIDAGDTRLALVNGRFSELIPFLPFLAMQSEADQQEARIRDLEAWVATQKRGAKPPP